MVTVQLLRAIRFAADKHRSQLRKDHRGSPYIVHPIAAAELLMECGVSDELTLIAAVLHDTIEDTECTAEEIAELFGSEAAELVKELTVMESGDKAADKAREIADACTLSERAALVRTADKLCNLADVIEDTPIGWSEERRDRYIFWAHRVVRAADVSNEKLRSRLNTLLLEAQRKFGRDFSAV